VLVRTEAAGWLRDRLDSISSAMPLDARDLAVTGRDATGLKAEVPWIRIYSCPVSGHVTHSKSHDMCRLIITAPIRWCGEAGDSQPGAGPPGVARAEPGQAAEVVLAPVCLRPAAGLLPDRWHRAQAGRWQRGGGDRHHR